MSARVAASLLAFASLIRAQTPPKRLSFEVASIRRADIAAQKSAGGQFRIGTQVAGNRVDMYLVTLTDVICQAYGLKSYQVAGADWLTSERYEIHAKFPDGAGKDELPEMLQSLLSDRYQLTFHRDTKEHAVYALVVGKGGIKWNEAEPDPPATADGSAAPAPGLAPVRITAGDKAAIEDGKVKVAIGDGKAVTSLSGGGSTRIDRKMTMPALCDYLNRFLDRPVLDMTALTATYHVVLDVSLDQLLKLNQLKNAIGARGSDGPAGAQASDPLDQSAVFHAIQDAGLKLDPRKAPIELLVVDHAERAVEN